MIQEGSSVNVKIEVHKPVNVLVREKSKTNTTLENNPTKSINIKEKSLENVKCKGGEILYSVIDELEYIYNRIIDSDGCIMLHVVDKNFDEEFVNLCSQAGYDGKPTELVVNCDKWTKVVYLFEFPDLYSETCKKLMNNDSSFRRDMVKHPQYTRIKFIIAYKEQLFKEACKMLGIPYEKANNIPADYVCNPQPIKKSVSKPQHKPSKEVSKETPGKPIHKSKTFWFGISVYIASIISRIFHVNVSPSDVMNILGLLIIIFRIITKEPIRW